MEHKLYVIEGLDGSGKATQATLLTDYLTGKGIPCRKLSFPDYNDPSSTLVKMYLHGEIGTLEEVNPYGASLFFTVDRYASYCRHWRPDYEAGKILVADRYSTSNIPHQMSRLPKEERDIHEADFAYLQHCRSAALYGAEKQGWHILSCTEQGEMLPREVIAEKIRLALGLE